MASISRLTYQMLLVLTTFCLFNLTIILRYFSKRENQENLENYFTGTGSSGLSHERSVGESLTFGRFSPEDDVDNLVEKRGEHVRVPDGGVLRDPPAATIAVGKDWKKDVNVSSLPWAKSIFHLDERDLPSQLQTKQPVKECPDKKYDPSAVEMCCEIVYFIGSYKCGSTTLAIQLKHQINNTEKYDPNSGFIDAGKEPCWAMSGSVKKVPPSVNGCKSCGAGEPGTPQPVKRNLLDACPYYTGTSAKAIFCSNPNARLVMLLRDPYDRVLSQYNSDVRRRNLKTPVDTFISNMSNLRHSNYYSILYEFLRYFQASQILLVQTESLTTQPQETVDQVRVHFGMETRKVNPFWGNKGQGDKTYTDPSKKINEEVLKKISGWNEQFFKLIGAKYNWKMFVDDASQ
ncbi:uncharacterized protein LOC134854319 isoform X2 [Symsagittifera roscoffensis]|uniref:uncharacterized protein LOC134854319 isoform X2 n=1 Tax=Symsagittifera roscoffensis TaxID=84072 RepID=UPI00307B1492